MTYKSYVTPVNHIHIITESYKIITVFLKGSDFY